MNMPTQPVASDSSSSRSQDSISRSIEAYLASLNYPSAHIDMHTSKHVGSIPGLFDEQGLKHNQHAEYGFLPKLVRKTSFDASYPAQLAHMQQKQKKPRSGHASVRCATLYSLSVTDLPYRWLRRYRQAHSRLVLEIIRPLILATLRLGHPRLAVQMFLSTSTSRRSCPQRNSSSSLACRHLDHSQLIKTRLQLWKHSEGSRPLKLCRLLSSSSSSKQTLSNSRRERSKLSSNTNSN